MLEEQWVSLDLIPNYEISNYGRVVNIVTGRELKPSPDSNGYLRLALYNNGVRYDALVHRLVAECYFLNYKPGVEVIHLNEDKSDNGVFNLSLGSGCRVGISFKN